MNLWQWNAPGDAFFLGILRLSCLGGYVGTIRVDEDGILVRICSFAFDGQGLRIRV